MRMVLKAALVVLLGALLTPVAPPDVQAADLAVKRVKHVRHHYRHRIYRDYDGTAIILRRYVPTVPVFMAWGGGTPIVVAQWTRTVPVQQQPTPYLYRRVFYPPGMVGNPYGPPDYSPPPVLVR